jgi:hypothetical protein
VRGGLINDEKALSTFYEKKGWGGGGVEEERKGRKMGVKEKYRKSREECHCHKETV